MHDLTIDPRRRVNTYSQLQQIFDNCWSLNLSNITLSICKKTFCFLHFCLANFLSCAKWWVLMRHLSCHKIQFIEPSRSFLIYILQTRNVGVLFWICFVLLLKRDYYLETAGIRDESLGKRWDLIALFSLAFKVRFIYILYGSKISSGHKSWQNRRNDNIEFFLCCSVLYWNSICVSSVSLWV